MDKAANEKINEYQKEINKLKEDGNGENSTKDLELRINSLKESIKERAEMGNKDDPMRYRFKKAIEKGVGTYLKKSNLVVMEYSDMGDAFHEQKHGYQIKMGELGGTGIFDPKYDVSDEVEAKRREYSFIKRPTPLMQNGYLGITDAKWVQRIIESNSDVRYKDQVRSYIPITNKWLKEHGQEIIK